MGCATLFTGIAELCDVPHQSIIDGADFKSAKLAQKLTAQGVKAVGLVESGFKAQHGRYEVNEYYADEITETVHAFFR